MHAPDTGKAECIARAVSPLGGRDGAKGGCKQEDRPEPARDFFIRIFPVHKIFPAFFIFVRKNPAARTFARIFFGFSNFQTKKKLAGEISIQNFLRFPTFAPKIFRPGKFRGKKSTGSLIPVPGPHCRIYDGEASQLPN